NLFLGLRLWDGGAVYLNPEIDAGYGLANSVGAASYVNAAVAKVGRAAPYMRFQRYFLRQIIGLNEDGEREKDPDQGSRSEVLESTQNQISGKVDKNRIVLTLGKFAVGDVFDDNVYAHDPTTGFLNFAFNTMGAFDYAADAWGYTYGLAAEWKQDWWTARAGVFQLSTTPNSFDIEPQLFRQFMGVAEFEARYDLFEQPGAIKFLVYGDNGYLSKIDDVIRYAYLAGDFPPRVDTARGRAVKTGGGINVKQQVAPHLGFFLRASMADGRYETVDYTDIDRSVAFGFVAGGALWGCDDDEIGVAGAFSGLHGSRVRYFELGGTSVYIGDGALSYAGEKNMEAYYKIGFGKNIDATFDYQLLVNPAHNSARGPVNVFGLRLRAAF
ncbi:MAG: porin, partial [Methylocystis sp.]